MNSSKVEVLALIPARGGSKGIHKKNLALFLGRPLVGHAVQQAQQSRFVTRVVVSTDDPEIVAVAKDFGAEAPFLRPEEFARDDSNDFVVFRHALSWLAENQRFLPEMVFNIRPTAPLRTSDDIDQAVLRLKESKADSVRSVTVVSGVHHPYWMFKPEGENLKPVVPGIDLGVYSRRQSLPKVLRLNGLVDGTRADNIMKLGQMWGPKVTFVEIPEERSVDIDTPFDLHMAEWMAKDTHGKENL